MALVVLLPMLAGYIFPEQLWGMHFLHFLSDWQTAAFMLIGAVAIWLASNEADSEPAQNAFDDKEKVWSRLRLSLSLVAGAIVVSTPMVVDVYGDSFSIIPHFSRPVDEWTKEMTSELISLDLTYPKIGEQTFYSISFFLSYLFNITPLTVVKYLELACFMLSIYFWSFLVQRSTQSLALRTALTFAGILAPFAFVYHAHTEMYALPFTFILGFLAYGRYVFDSGLKNKHIIGLWILFVLGAKFHIMSLLLFPVPLLVTASKLKFDSHQMFKKYAHWAMLLAGLVLVIFGYVFITESVNGTRVFTKVNLYDAVFLPISCLEGPPLDRYDLLSWSHISDYLNMVYLWGPVLWGFIFIGWKSLVSELEESSYAKGLVLSFSAFALVFFILNPLLGMPADWDLFLFPAMTFMPLSLLGVKSIEQKYLNKAALLIALLSLMNLPLLITHLSKEKLSERLTYEGLYEFKTYWKGSSSTLKLAGQLKPISEQAAYLTNIIDQLRPYAVVGLDNEYAELLRTLAATPQIQSNPDQKLKVLEDAYYFGPLLIRNTYELCLEYARRREFGKAKPLISDLVNSQFPNPKQATKLGVYVFMMTNDIPSAKQICIQSVKQWPQEPFYSSLLEALNNGDFERALKLINEG